MALFNPNKVVTEHAVQQMGNPFRGQSAYAESTRVSKNMPNHFRIARAYANATSKGPNRYSGDYASAFLYIRPFSDLAKKQK